MSNALFIEGDIKKVDSNKISLLKEKAFNSANGRYRYCLHNGISDDIQNMIIAITAGSELLPQRRVGSSKCFSIIEGEITIIVFNEAGEVIELINLVANDTQTIWISDKYYTLTYPRSSIAVYQEVITGHFDYQNDYPNWQIDNLTLKSIISQTGA